MDEERPKLMTLLQLRHSRKLAVIYPEDSAILERDYFAVILLYHLFLVRQGRTRTLS